MARMKQLLHDMESFRYSPQFKQTVDDMMTTGGYTYEQIASKVEITVDELHFYLSFAT
jgi:transposase-like protein|tara:strand:+ start:205 stop:378 length:174 start_codon:yes stop_codon:yes gene_type:complete